MDNFRSSLGVGMSVWKSYFNIVVAVCPIRAKMPPNRAAVTAMGVKSLVIGVFVFVRPLKELGGMAGGDDGDPGVPNNQSDFVIFCVFEDGAGAGSRFDPGDRCGFTVLQQDALVHPDVLNIESALLVQNLLFR